MDHIIAPFKSRTTSRNYLHAQYTLTEKALGRESNPYEEEEGHSDESLLISPHTRRAIMSNSHRRFHRRAPQAGIRVLTVNVEVVATLDTAGNVVAQTTVTQTNSSLPIETTQALPTTNNTGVSALSTIAESSASTAVAPSSAASTPEVPSIASLPSETQSVVPSTPADPSRVSGLSASAEPSMATVVALPSVPSVPAVPSVTFPSVPSVPGFPSTLTVPAYPFASSSLGLVAADAVSAASSISNAASSSSSSALVVGMTAAESTNSTTSSISGSTSIAPSLAPSPTLLSTMSGFTYSSTSGFATAQSAISFESSRSGASSTTSVRSYVATPTESLDAAGSSSFYGSGGPGWNGAPGTATAGSPTGTTAAISDADASGTGPLDTPQVVGSVVGSLAGAALILAIILILLRRHKRRQNGGALQLTDGQHTDNEQAMRQAQAPVPARASLVPSAFLNRFSGLSKSTAETISPTERSFQRVSGRKLPSAFSEGMTSDQFSRGGTLSGSSFYQDDHGTYGGSGGLNKEFGGDFGKEIGETSFAGGAAGTMNLRPSPARTPVIRHPEENPFNDNNRSTLSPPMSPNPFSSPNPDLLPRAALGRSLHSADGSRSSRFTENV